MRLDLDSPGSRRFWVYLNGQKMRGIHSADDEAGTVEEHVDERGGGWHTRIARGTVEFRLAADTSAEEQTAIEQHYGRRFVRETE